MRAFVFGRDDFMRESCRRPRNDVCPAARAARMLFRFNEGLRDSKQSGQPAALTRAILHTQLDTKGYRSDGHSGAVPRAPKQERPLPVHHAYAGATASTRIWEMEMRAIVRYGRLDRTSGIAMPGCAPRRHVKPMLVKEHESASIVRHAIDRCGGRSTHGRPHEPDDRAYCTLFSFALA